jgi:hypothetical protein
VTVLPNGNFVVTDPSYSSASTSNIGAVYLYSPTGTLISTLTGSSANDAVGGAVYVVGVSNFVVCSGWNNGSATSAGAATWINGNTGLSGVVSASNSLVGTNASDFVCGGGVTTLSNGNYVVASPFWTGGVPGGASGAITWGSGANGVKGPVSELNSLIGSYPLDNVGYRVIALSNGNYVVVSPAWSNNTSPPGIQDVGAVTWGDGASASSGEVSPSNSLIGATANDTIGSAGVIALSNGNYVVASPFWNNGTVNGSFGAATWVDGNRTTADVVSGGNSLVGSHTQDSVGMLVVALRNGNYVVASPGWNNATTNGRFGAVTWGDGSKPTTDIVSTSNSLVGTTSGDVVGTSVTALSNGNYVVASADWNNGITGGGFGAVTWGDGTQVTSGTVSTSNSIVGSTTGDAVGNYGIAALSNGNYAIVSPGWNNRIGAVTWGSGAHATAGIVSAANSVIGSISGDLVGSGGIAEFSNGNFVIASPSWNNGVAGNLLGATTWIRSVTGIADVLVARRSLAGTTASDQIGFRSITSLSDGNYVVVSSDYNNGVPSSNVGAVTLASGRFRLKGTIQPWNSVIGGIANGGTALVFAYDATRARLAVGRPYESIVSLFTMDQIFAEDFDP